MLPVDCLQVVFLLLHLEDVLHEKLLQILICIVDAELLKTVRVEVFKAKNVQDTNCTLVVKLELRFEYCIVDLLNNVDEQPAVDSLGEGVSDIFGLVCVEGGRKWNKTKKKMIIFFCLNWRSRQIPTEPSSENFEYDMLSKLFVFAWSDTVDSC